MLTILAGWAIVPAIFEAAPHFPWEFYSVLALGFVAAVSLGSLAWYNSKRPAGWEDKERPKVIPKIDQD
jgi:hypothetical protein